LPTGFNKADFTSSCGQETYGIVDANFHLAITNFLNDQMRRILLLSILCPQFVAGICWGGDGLDTWTVRTNSLSSTNWLYDIAYGNDQFVAVGGSQVPSFGGWFHGAGVITTSADGTNWFQKTIPSGTGTLVGLTHAAGFYVAVGNTHNPYLTRRRQLERASLWCYQRPDSRGLRQRPLRRRRLQRCNS